VPNTKTGHCEKTMEIFRYIHSELSTNDSLRDIEWIFLADDDTILRLVENFQLLINQLWIKALIKA
jgi:hypothetical protein